MKIKSGFTQVAYCIKKSFLELFARLQTKDINGMSPNPFSWRCSTYYPLFSHFDSLL